MLEPITPILVAAGFILGAWKVKVNVTNVLVGILLTGGAVAAPQLFNALPLAGELVGLVLALGASVISGAVLLYVANLVLKNAKL